jgi:Timeless protein
MFIYRLLVNLTNPALLIYNEELPKDGPSRRNYLDLIEILQDYKENFTLEQIWTVFNKMLQKFLEVVSTYLFIHINFVMPESHSKLNAFVTKKERLK